MSGEGEAERWLASVESPLTREQHHFANLESLFAFLRTKTGQGIQDNTGAANSQTDSSE